MNILPKKRWHVRTKDNIARVRRDEAQAAEEERKKQMRIEIAEREARREALRQKARQQYSSHCAPSPKTPEPETSANKHINLFYELEQNEIVSEKGNRDYEEEKKLEKEKYEKQIGYLTYLGQDTNEITGQVSWYNKPREGFSTQGGYTKQEEIAKKQKAFEDPLEDIRKYLGCEGIQKIKKLVTTEKKGLIKNDERSDSGSSPEGRKHKKNKKSKKKNKKHKRSYLESEVEEKKKTNIDLERLRAERLRREREERKRADEALARLNGVKVKEKEVQRELETSQRYHSQFNPHIAKQNYVNR